MSTHMTMIEKVATAISEVQLFSRYNDWTSDRVPGLPVEICRYGKADEDGIVIVARYGDGVGEAEALAIEVRRARARAAISAMREPSKEMVEASNREWDGRMSHRSTGAWQAMIDAALAGPHTR